MGLNLLRATIYKGVSKRRAHEVRGLLEESRIHLPQAPHLARIKEFLAAVFPGLHKRIDFVWSGTFGETETKTPLIEQKGDRIIVAAAASQVMCVAAAKHVADRLMGKRSPLTPFFKQP
jgi:glycine/D-amino acid oxidase-like deaminating enzyme